MVAIQKTQPASNPERAQRPLRAPAQPSAVQSISGSRPSGADDDVLLQRVLEGQPRAWKTFTRRFGALLLAVAAKVSARSGFWLDGEELRDLVQDSYVRMLDHNCRRLRSYRDDQGVSVATWLALIAETTVKDHIRRLARRPPRTSSDAALEGLTSLECSAFERLAVAEQRLALRRGLEELSARDQEFATLCFVEEVPCEGIMQRMQIASGTVYSKRSKIRAGLATSVRAAWSE